MLLNDSHLNQLLIAMKNSVWKLFLVFLGFILAQNIHAQIYSSEVCFYIKTGESLENNPGGLIFVLFDGNQLVRSNYTSFYIKNRLREDPNFFDKYLKNLKCKDCTFEYSSSMSTSKREVYRYRYPGYRDSFLNYAPEWRCIAVSLDKSSLIYWNESDSGAISGKQYYVRVNKSDLLPKGSNHDFLYE